MHFMQEKIIKEYQSNILSTPTAMRSVKYLKYYCKIGHKLDTVACVYRTWPLKCRIQLEICNIILLFSWRYNPLSLYFHSPVAGFSLLVFEVS